jgi:hypothetical protein
MGDQWSTLIDRSREGINQSHRFLRNQTLLMISRSTTTTE